MKNIPVCLENCTPSPRITSQIHKFPFNFRDCIVRVYIRDRIWQPPYSSKTLVHALVYPHNTTELKFSNVRTTTTLSTIKYCVWLDTNTIVTRFSPSSFMNHVSCRATTNHLQTFIRKCIVSIFYVYNAAQCVLLNEELRPLYIVSICMEIL